MSIRSVLLFSVVGIASTAHAQSELWAQVYYTSSEAGYPVVDTLYTTTNDGIGDEILLNVYCSDTQTENVAGDPTQDPPTWSPELETLQSGPSTEAGHWSSIDIPAGQTLIEYGNWAVTVSSQEFEDDDGDYISRSANAYWGQMGCDYWVGTTVGGGGVGGKGG